MVAHLPGLVGLDSDLGDGLGTLYGSAFGNGEDLIAGGCGILVEGRESGVVLGGAISAIGRITDGILEVFSGDGLVLDLGGSIFIQGNLPYIGLFKVVGGIEVIVGRCLEQVTAVGLLDRIALSLGYESVGVVCVGTHDNVVLGGNVISVDIGVVCFGCGGERLACDERGARIGYEKIALSCLDLFSLGHLLVCAGSVESGLAGLLDGHHEHGLSANEGDGSAAGSGHLIVLIDILL